MHATEPIQRVRIYVRERDTVEGQPLYLVVLERLRSAGATGATALRGVVGFGAGSQLHAAGPFDLPQSSPILIEWVDRIERIARILPLLDDLLPTALITVEELRAYRATLRSSGPFGERLVGEVVKRDVAALHPSAALVEVARIMIETPQQITPIVSDDKRLVSLITAGDLERHGTLPPLRLLQALTPDLRELQLNTLRSLKLSEIASTDPHALSAEAPLSQAVSTLIEWGLESLPVVDRSGHFEGLFGVDQALSTALEQRRSGGPIRDAQPMSSVHLLMQRVVPTVAATAPVIEALAQLRLHAEHFLIAINGDRPIGVLTDVQLVAALTDPLLQLALIEALRASNLPLDPSLTKHLADWTISDVPLAPVLTIPALTTRDEAIQTLLSQNQERLLVVDEAGHLLGLVGRRGLLRALAQESMA